MPICSFLYIVRSSTRNKKIYNLLADQDDTIRLQSKAIEYQSIYKEMEYRYSKIHYPIDRSQFVK